MRMSTRLFLPLLTCALVLSAIGCPKPVETGEVGRGGLPIQRVEEGAPPQVEEYDYPVYPGAVEEVPGEFHTNDAMDQVREYYENELNVTPVSFDVEGEALTFDTEEFKLILLQLPDSAGGGTQIRFELKD